MKVKNLRRSKTSNTIYILEKTNDLDSAITQNKEISATFLLHLNFPDIFKVVQVAFIQFGIKNTRLRTEGRENFLFLS